MRKREKEHLAAREEEEEEVGEETAEVEESKRRGADKGGAATAAAMGRRAKAEVNRIADIAVNCSEYLGRKGGGDEGGTGETAHTD